MSSGATPPQAPARDEGKRGTGRRGGERREIEVREIAGNVAAVIGCLCTTAPRAGHAVLSGVCVTGAAMRVRRVASDTIWQSAETQIHVSSGAREA